MVDSIPVLFGAAAYFREDHFIDFKPHHAGKGHCKTDPKIKGVYRGQLENRPHCWYKMQQGQENS